MAREFVWAVDENGKPCKCFAKPENRGKGKCNHRFHARPNQDAKEFFEQYNIDKNMEEEILLNKTRKRKHYTTESLPDYSDKIKELIHVVDSDPEEYSDIVEKVLHDNDYTTFDYFNGTEVEVSQEDTSPDDPNSSRITMIFKTEDGNEITQSFDIPKRNDMGEYIIDGVPYRYIPYMEKDNKGLCVTQSGKLLIKDEYGWNTLVHHLDKDFSNIKVKDNNGEYIWENKIPNEEINKFFNGEENSLTEKQRESLSSLDPIVYERLKEEGGYNSLIELPPDTSNDISYKKINTFNDKLATILSKNFRSMNSSYEKAKKNGNDYDFALTVSLTDKIKNNMVTSPQMQMADNLNPIAAISQSQRVSLTGLNGFSEESAPRNLRFPHESHKDLIDTNDTAMGGRVGLNVAIKGHINKNGVLERDSNVLSGSDFIPYKENSDPLRSSMAIAQMRQACPLVNGEDPKLSTKGWDQIKGSKLGVNLTTAYISEIGTHEDAVIISESAAKKMLTVQTQGYNMTELPSKDVGEEVRRGEYVGGVKVKYPGKIKSIKDGKLVVESNYAMGVGDKLSGRYGNKGVVSKVLPDDQMPKVNGKTADLIMSPIGVAGRSNLGQIYEVNKGDLNKKSKIEYQGKTLEGTGGTQFIMRVNKIADKTLSSNDGSLNDNKEYKTRFGEMEQILLSTNENRLEILDYLKHQRYSDSEHKLDSLLKSVGIELREKQE